jgi:hypothetical protein
MNAPSVVSAPSRPAALLTGAVADLAAILEPGCGVAVLRRPPCPDLAGYLDGAAGAGRLGSGFRVILAPGESPGAALLPDAPGRSAMIRELAEVAELYADLLGCPRIGLRWEVTSAAMCPRFHTDRVGIRLLCTYRGPGTEWIDPAAADTGAEIAAGRIRHAQPFDLVLLKGEAWPGHEGFGAVHRSPGVPPEAAPRVLLALDALW